MEEQELINSLVPAVKEQLNAKETTYVRKTYQRLLKLKNDSPAADSDAESNENISEDEALKMIALCLADESNRMFIDKRNFDEMRYQELLNALPNLPEG